MFGTLITLVGIGGIIYIASSNKEKPVTNNISKSVTNSNVEHGGLNVLKERYTTSYIAIESLYNNPILNKRSSYYGIDNDIIKLNLEIHSNLDKIIVGYLNKGTITKEDEKTKRLLNFLDLLLDQHLKIVQLNKVLDMYSDNSIPLEVLSEVNDIVSSLLQEYVELDTKLTLEAKERAFGLLNSIKNNEFNSDISNVDLNVRLSQDGSDIGSIGNTTTNLKSLLDDKEWKD